MVMTAPVATDVQRFRELVEAALGLHFDDGAVGNLQRVLTNRLAVRGQDCEDYLVHLADRRGAGAEIAALAAELTVGETYFLRHLEQFQALTGTVVPELLRTPRPGPLRLLSAGCSTGEEAYSLAIALRERGVTAAVSILGVDVSPVSIARARSGVYNEWSLRSVPPDVRRRWFTVTGSNVVVHPEIQAAVRFERCNFAEDDAVLWRPGSFDVIFCRNVIMYFAPALMSRIVARFARSLIPGGYLFLGSAETLRGLSTDFGLCESDGTFYYRRTTGPLAEEVAVTTSAVRAAPAAGEPAATRTSPTGSILEPGQLDAVLELFGRERFAEALSVMDALPAPAEADPEVLLLRAALLAHSGRLSAAEQACHRLLEIDRRSAGAHVLLAMCREGEQDLPAAVAHCRTAITFDPAFAMPHVHLGRLAVRMGDRGTAQRQYATSARLLPAETGRRILIFGGGFDREALISLCRAQGAAAGEHR
jgi:chemotaxis protein methyltransferase CheR